MGLVAVAGASERELRIALEDAAKLRDYRVFSPIQQGYAAATDSKERQHILHRLKVTSPPGIERLSKR